MCHPTQLNFRMRSGEGRDTTYWPGARTLTLDAAGHNRWERARFFGCSELLQQSSPSRHSFPWVLGAASREGRGGAMTSRDLVGRRRREASQDHLSLTVVERSARAGTLRLGQCVWEDGEGVWELGAWEDAGCGRRKRSGAASSWVGVTGSNTWPTCRRKLELHRRGFTTGEWTGPFSSF
jgi:hypothetical protein